MPSAADPSVTIRIAGATIDQIAAGLLLESITWDLDRGGGPVSAELIEDRCDRSRFPSWHGSHPVEIDFDFGAGPVRMFAGEISTADPTYTAEGWVIQYECAGLVDIVNRICITNPDGDPSTYTFNRRRNDPLFAPSLSGKTIGEATVKVLDDHAAALAAVGVLTPFPLAGADRAQFIDNLDVVPVEPFEISGEHIWDTLADRIEQYHPGWKLGLTATGLIKLYNPYDAPTATLTWIEGSDPVEWLQAPRRDTSRCYTRVVIRGQDDIKPIYLKLSKGGIREDWTDPEHDAWKYEDFLKPSSGARFEGTVTCTATTVTFNPTDNSLAFAADTYGPDGLQGTIFLRAPSLMGLVQEYNTVYVASHGALAAGGTVTAVIEPELATTVYTEGTWSGLATGRSHVWRRYKIADQYDNLIRQIFPRPVAFVYAQSVGEMQTQSPMVTVQYPGGETALPAVIDPVANTIMTPVPVTIYTNGMTDTGDAVDPPDEVIACIPVKMGPLQAICPEDGYMASPVYSGTAYTVEGIERTLTLDIPTWNDAAARPRVQKLACEYLKSYRDTVITCSMVRHEIVEAACGVGWALNVAGDGYTTGHESMAIPMRSLVLQCRHSGGPTPWIMQGQFSSQRRPFSGDRNYTHGLEKPTYDGRFGAGTALESTGMVFTAGVSSELIAATQGAAYLTSGQYAVDTAARMSQEANEVAGNYARGFMANAARQNTAAARALAAGKADDRKKQGGQSVTELRGEMNRLTGDGSIIPEKDRAALQARADGLARLSPAGQAAGMRRLVGKAKNLEQIAINKDWKESQRRLQDRRRAELGAASFKEQLRKAREGPKPAAKERQRSAAATNQIAINKDWKESQRRLVNRKRMDREVGRFRDQLQRARQGPGPE